MSHIILLSVFNLNVFMAGACHFAEIRGAIFFGRQFLPNFTDKASCILMPEFTAANRQNLNSALIE
jgi:hypothetical protein